MPKKIPEKMPEKMAGKTTGKTAGKTLRLFFALWPDHDTRQELARAASQVNPDQAGRRVPAYNLHMTLHFIGNTSQAQAECLRQQAWQVNTRPFNLLIDRSGQFAGPRVTWLSCSNAPDALFDLHRQLGDQIGPDAGCGYSPERRTYRPHVTVYRKTKAIPAVELLEPISWQVNDFSLILSEPEAGGVRYRQWQRYPLDE